MKRIKTFVAECENREDLTEMVGKVDDEVNEFIGSLTRRAWINITAQSTAAMAEDSGIGLCATYTYTVTLVYDEHDDY